MTPATRPEASAADALAALLDEPARDARERAAEALAVRSAGRPLVLHGAGGAGRRALAALRSGGVEPLCFSDAAGGGREVDGLAVLSLEEAAARHGADAAFVVCVVNPAVPHAAVAAALEAAGCDVVVPFAPLAWAHADALLPYFAIGRPHRVLEDAPRVRAALELLADDASRTEFVAQVRVRLDGDPGALAPHLPTAEQYFAADLFALRDDEAFVDGGAFDGDTVRAFAARTGGRFERLLALEPDPENVRALRAAVAALPAAVAARVDVRPVALAAAPGRLRFGGGGTAAAAPDPSGAAEVEAAPLDAIAGERPVTYLKLDVEAAEPAALRGAADVIARDRPVLAVCVYHLQEHLWQLPLQVAGQVGEGYRFHLRRYAADTFDAVLYAVPAERSVSAGT